MTYAEAKARRDTRGQHYAARKALIQTTIALSANVHGKRTKKHRNIKAIMGMK